MMDNQGYDIAFQNVGFSYNIGDAVLKDVTFTAARQFLKMYHLRQNRAKLPH